MTHYRNIGFILRNGLHCCNCGVHDPEYINIGHKTLIDYRGQSPIAQPPGGVLNDYIPFYFWPKMPMLYHIYQGMVKDYIGTQGEIIYLVSTVEKIQAMNLAFLFTDRHAYLAHKTIFNDYSELDQLSWDIIKDNTWHKEYSALRKELKQAEFLIHQHLPVNGISGLVAQNDEIATFVRNEIAGANLPLQVIVKPEYYYP
jgi:hypothetical protein